MIKKIIKISFAILLATAVILAPVGFILGMSFVAPSQYSNTFLGALDAKYARLTSIKDDKIVVVGGSSVAFGIDSALIEKYTGMPVVNFGLYADLGTRLMLDLSRDHIKEGDVVIISPELDAQTFSMYFSWENTLKAFDDDMSMLGELDRSIDEWLFSIEGFWSLASAKLGYSVDGNTPNPKDIYNAANFNEYGDIDPSKFPRESNEIKGYYLKGENYDINLDPSIVEREFLDYMNAYIRDCKKNGAAVYFSWCPVNSLATERISNEKILAFEQFFRDNLECEVLSSLKDYILDYRYFYDTNFHLNDAGVKVRTINLLRDLSKKYPGMDSESLNTEAEPEPPEPLYPPVDDGPVDANAVYFTFERTSTGTYGITGLSELGKRNRRLTVPRNYQGPDDGEPYRVTEIDMTIFEQGDCNTLIIPADTNLSSMMGSVSYASSLSTVYIYTSNHEDLVPPSFPKDNPAFKVHVPAGAGYRESYNWSAADSSGILVEDL